MNEFLNIEEILSRLEKIEKKSPDSTLVYYTPEAENMRFYLDLCEYYRKSPECDRRKISEVLNGKKGILNRLLGLVWECSEKIIATKDIFWLITGLTAAQIEGGRLDYRDFLLALSELYVAAAETGINPKEHFNEAGGAVPKDFTEYAVLGNRMNL